MRTYDELGIEIPPSMLAERQRQIDVEGWSAEHDSNHDCGGLLVVAMFYYRHGAGLTLPMQTVSCNSFAVDGQGHQRRTLTHRRVPVGWPWAPKWWKPKTPDRDLDRAGALCLAEIDRLRAIEPECDVSVAALVLADIVRAYAARAALAVAV